MFIVLLTYKADLAELDKHLDAHRAWLHEGVASGRLMVAGRLVPRTGGAMFVRAADRAEAEAWLRTDPFAIADVADYQLLEYDPTVIAPGLEAIGQ
jgi:uncharacterized protein YciI